MEELWTELSTAWPAVKKNPDIAEKIEKLWDILKTSGHAYAAINQEVHNLNESNRSSFISSDKNPALNTVTYQNRVTQADNELDNLLAEILGENYQEVLNYPATQTDVNQNLSSFPDIKSGIEELDKLVAPILGKNWLNAELETTPAPASFKTSDNKKDGSIDNPVSSIIDKNIHIESDIASPSPYVSGATEDNKDIDELLNEIISEDDLNLQPKSHTIQEKEDIDILINEVLNQGTASANDEIEETASTGNEEKEDINELINQVLKTDSNKKDIASSLKNYNNDETTPAIQNSEENIDELINAVLKADSSETELSPDLDISDSEQAVPTTQESEENVDELINTVLKTDSNKADITPSLDISDSEQTLPATQDSEKTIDELINTILKTDSDKADISTDLNLSGYEQAVPTTQSNEESVDELINEILENKPGNQSDEVNIEEINITDITDNTPIQKTAPRKVKSDDIADTKNTSYEQPEKENNNTLIIILLLILLLSLVAGWWFLMKQKEPTLKKSITTKTAPVTKTLKAKPKVETEKPVIQKIEIKPEPEKTPLIKQDPVNSTMKYSADENDITIILNSPETAIDTSNDSNIFNETEAVTTEEIEQIADDKIVESINEVTQPVKELNEKELVIEKAKKIKPKKTVAKRKVIIHKIVKGDTLWAIAKRYVNNPYRYPELARLSKIKNPDRIYPGNKVRIIIYTK